MEDFLGDDSRKQSGEKGEWDREGGRARRRVLFYKCCIAPGGLILPGSLRITHVKDATRRIYLSTSSWPHLLRNAPGSCNCSHISWLLLCHGLAASLSFGESPRAESWSDPWLAPELEEIWAHTGLSTYYSCGCNQGGSRVCHKSTCCVDYTLPCSDPLVLVLCSLCHCTFNMEATIYKKDSV